MIMPLNYSSKKWLEKHFKHLARFDEPMAAHTSFKVGGPADAFVEPETRQDLYRLIRWTNEKGLSCLIVGGGTNLLVTDRGYDGIVISIRRCLDRIVVGDQNSSRIKVTAMAGARLGRLCSFAVSRGYAGMNFALGIPGTIGGAIMMNAGTARGCIADVLDSAVFLLPAGEVRAVARGKLDFSYRTLSWKTGNLKFNLGRPVILEGCFILLPSDKVRLKKEAEMILAQRKAKQPTTKPGAGCFFKNPPSGESAGALIDRAGLKGTKVGGAEISSQHANFIINKKTATAADILELAGRVRQVVSDKFKVQLETEVDIVGN